MYNLDYCSEYSLSHQSKVGVSNRNMRKENHIDLVMRRMGISMSVCPTYETFNNDIGLVWFMLQGSQNEGQCS